MGGDRAQLQAFLIHLGVYFIATIVLFLVNFQVAPSDLVVIWPLLAWGTLVALHAARVMDLLPTRRR